jgi:hypothetical protein
MGAPAPRVRMLTTPPSAPLPWRCEKPPRNTSTRLTDARGTRPQLIQPPNGSFKGMPSARTSARLAPLAPVPRRETPCVVGLAVRLPARLNNWKPAT